MSAAWVILGSLLFAAFVIMVQLSPDGRRLFFGTLLLLAFVGSSFVGGIGGAGLFVILALVAVAWLLFEGLRLILRKVCVGAANG